MSWSTVRMLLLVGGEACVAVVLLAVGLISDPYLAGAVVYPAATLGTALLFGALAGQCMEWAQRGNR